MEETCSCSELLAAAFGSPEPGVISISSLRQLLLVMLNKIEDNQTIEHSAEASHTEEQPEESKEMKQPAERFEDTEAYRELIRKIDQLETAQHTLTVRLLAEQRVSGTIMPTVEQLEEYRSSRTQSTLHPGHENAIDYLTLVSRLDKIDETIGNLTSLANDTVLEYARIEKSILPLLEGDVLGNIHAQLDTIHQQLKAQCPDYRPQRRSLSSAVRSSRSSRPMDGGPSIPIDFYQHAVPSSLKALVPRRSTLAELPSKEDLLQQELDGIKTILLSLISGLPLPGTADQALTISSTSSALDVTTENLRALWPRALEEMLTANQDRIEALEEKQNDLERCLNAKTERDRSTDGSLKQLTSALQDHELKVQNQLHELRANFSDQALHLESQLQELKQQTDTHLQTIDHELERRVQFEHFRTRVSLDQFNTAIEQLHEEIDREVEFFSDELQRIWGLLQSLSTSVADKCERDSVELMETRLRRSLTHTQLMMTKLKGLLAGSIQAAGTKRHLQPDGLRCLSCNHAAMMQSLEQLVPTGKELFTAELKREQRISRLKGMAKREMAKEQRSKTIGIPVIPVQGATTRPDMERPDQLAYTVHPEESDGQQG
uniref:DUF4795 domain-containing protein n=1 Tax=Anopheles albimanus TaxID=7167 RepID=A0A182FVU7_ANOAL